MSEQNPSRGKLSVPRKGYTPGEVEVLMVPVGWGLPRAWKIDQKHDWILPCAPPARAGRASGKSRCVQPLLWGLINGVGESLKRGSALGGQRTARMWVQTDVGSASETVWKWK